MLTVNEAPLGFARSQSCRAEVAAARLGEKHETGGLVQLSQHLVVSF